MQEGKKKGKHAMAGEKMQLPQAQSAESLAVLQNLPKRPATTLIKESRRDSVVFDNNYDLNDDIEDH